MVAIGSIRLSKLNDTVNPCQPTEKLLMNTYFAYGSNLDSEDWQRWCAEHGYSTNLLRPVERVEPVGGVYLPDHELKFSYYSAARGGGALNAVPRIGQAVEGALFEVAGNEGWAALHQKEGHPHRYSRTQVTIVDEGGHRFKAMTYLINQPDGGRFVPPAAGYVEIVRRGMQRLNLQTKFLDAAASNELIPPVTNSLFCYGTLMRGQSRFAHLAAHRIEQIFPATTCGRLVDLGEYPGMIEPLGHDSGTKVSGELFETGDISAVLPLIDDVEDFRGYDASDSLYSRRLVQADIGNDQPRLAWSYFYEGGDGSPIPSGCWRTHGGGISADW